MPLLQNDYGIAILLGLIEGATEFIPVSSTAHLRIAQSWLGLSLENEYWKMFAVVIQLGAILAVVIEFRRRIWGMVSTFPTWSAPKTSPLSFGNHPITLTFIAFFVTAIPSFLLSKIIGKNLESLSLMGTSLLVGGIAMAAIEIGCKTARIHRLEDMRMPQASAIGAFQILSALFPGTSRSMSTIAGGQLMGLSREAALEFSFLLAIPTMFAATGYDLLKAVLNTNALQHGSQSFSTMGTHEWGVLLTGFWVSFASSWVVIRWLISWVRTRGFLHFAAYRVILGLSLVI